MFILISSLSHLTAAGTFELEILHTGDVRGAQTPVSPTGSDCLKPSEWSKASCVGGAWRRAGYAADVRAQANNVILVDFGTILFGTLFTTNMNTILAS